MAIVSQPTTHNHKLFVKYLNTSIIIWFFLAKYAIRDYFFLPSDTAYRKHDDTWYHFDDTQVTPVSGFEEAVVRLHVSMESTAS